MHAAQLSPENMPTYNSEEVRKYELRGRHTSVTLGLADHKDLQSEHHAKYANESSGP